MRHPGRAIIRLLLPMSVLVPPAPLLTAQPPQGQVRRLRGVIDQDQTWSGRIMITDDLTIQGATVTIAAGTTIEFADKRPDHHPTLTVGTPTRAGGHLTPLGTAEQPISFRTMPGTNPGRLVINLRSRIIPAQRSDPEAMIASPPERVPCDAAWQHVRFRNLGYVRANRQQGKTTPVSEPAVTFNATGAPHTLGVVNCTIQNCTRLVVRAADGAKITLVSNRFVEPKDRIAIEVRGHEGAKPAGQITLARNTLTAAISLLAAPAVIEGNILIGLDASITLTDDLSAETRIAGNYVHNTTEEDDGRYCLNCENPAALIQNNIFRGGTTCVRAGSRRMVGNVFIAAPKLSSRLVKNARTHQLVNALPKGATFERNWLLGPAYSLLNPQPLWHRLPAGGVHRQDACATMTIIRNNLFDGFANSNRAIHLNPLGRDPTIISVFNNLFLRIPTLVYDEARTNTTLTYADYNAVAPTAARAFDQVKISGLRQGDAGWGAKDVRCQDVASLNLSGALPRHLPHDDVAMLAGRISVDQLRQRLLNAYRPSASSPLVHAGRPQDASGNEAPPSIGPSAPADR